MRVSRAMNTEGMALVYKKGAFRIGSGHGWYGSKSDVHHFPPNLDIWKKIQNFDIVVRISNSRTDLETNRYTLQDYLDCLMQWAQPGGVCNLRFEVDHLTRWKYINDHINFLQGVTIFDTLVLQIGINPGFWEFAETTKETKKLLKKRIKYKYKILALARELLEPYLGKSVTGPVARGSYLTFHPRTIPKYHRFRM